MRLNATIRITAKNNETGELHKIELAPLPFPARKYVLRFDGKPSAKVQAASLTQVCARLRRLLIMMTKQKSRTQNS
jgi:hypothetical protein